MSIKHASELVDALEYIASDPDLNDIDTTEMSELLDEATRHDGMRLALSSLLNSNQNTGTLNAMSSAIRNIRAQQRQIKPPQAPNTKNLENYKNQIRQNFLALQLSAHYGVLKLAQQTAAVEQTDLISLNKEIERSKAEILAAEKNLKSLIGDFNNAKFVNAYEDQFDKWNTREEEALQRFQIASGVAAVLLIIVLAFLTLTKPKTAIENAGISIIMLSASAMAGYVLKIFSDSYKQSKSLRVHYQHIAMSAKFYTNYIFDDSVSSRDSTDKDQARNNLLALPNQFPHSIFDESSTNDAALKLPNNLKIGGS